MYMPNEATFSQFKSPRPCPDFGCLTYFFKYTQYSQIKLSRRAPPGSVRLVGERCTPTLGSAPVTRMCDPEWFED
mgnify:CR=1 FL=1